MHSADNGGGSRAVCCSWDCRDSSSGYNEAKLAEAFETYGSIDKVTAPKSLSQQGTGVVVFKHRGSATSAVAGWREDLELKVWRREKERKDGFLEDNASVETTASGEGGLTSEEDLQTAKKATTEEQVESELETSQGVKNRRSENVEVETHKRSRREGREKKKEKKRRKREKSEKGDKSREKKFRERYSTKSDDESRQSELVEHRRRRKDDRDKGKDDKTYSDRRKEREARHKQEDSFSQHHHDGDERYDYRDINEEEGDDNERGHAKGSDCCNESRDKDYRRSESNSRHKDRDKRRRRDRSYDGEDRRSHGDGSSYKEDNNSSREELRKRHRDKDEGIFDDEYKDRDYRRSWKDDDEYRRSYKGDEEYRFRHRASMDHYRDDERRSANDFRNEGNHRKGPSTRRADSNRDYKNRGSLDWSKSPFPPYALHYSMYGYGYFGPDVYSHAGCYGYQEGAVKDDKEKHLSDEEPLQKDTPKHPHEQPAEAEATADEDATSFVKTPGYLDLKKLLSRLSVSAKLAGPEAYGEYVRFMADQQIEVPDVEPLEVSVTDEPDDDLILEADPEAEALLRSKDRADRVFPALPSNVFEDALKLYKQAKAQ